MRKPRTHEITAGKENPTEMNFRNRLFPSLPVEMERITGEFRPEVDSAAGRSSGLSYPNAEITESDDSCEVHVFIPGLESESVIVEIGEDLLVLSGLRWEELCQGEGDRRLRSFRRSIDLPAPVGEDSWQATYYDDTLILSLKKTGGLRPLDG